MKRIGIVASKIAKGNYVLYNVFVILVSSLFSFFIFIVVGSTVIFALMLISYLTNEMAFFEEKHNWGSVIQMCMIALTIIITIFNMLAISVNIKIQKKQDKR